MIPPSSHAGPAGTPEAFEAFFASLATRRARDFKALHVLVLNGEMIALDFFCSVQVVKPAEPYAKRVYACQGTILTAAAMLVPACDARLALLVENDNTIPFLAPKRFWREFWDLPFIGMRTVDMEHAARGRAFFILRGRL